MIYLFDDIGNIPDDIIDSTFPQMPVERQQKALRYRYVHDKNMCVMAYWLLLSGLRKEYGIIESPTFSYGENGKPFLSEYPDIFFNFSHCKTGIVCAISSDVVGIDIQDVRPFNIDVAKRVCLDEELEQLTQCLNPERLFCKLWTIKESFIKKLGANITYPLHSLYAYSLLEQADCKVISHWAACYHINCFGEDEIVKISPEALW